jgi:mersacidin/lichenicidin family type 2 lantibiotic
MSHLNIVRAWKDPEYRRSLSEAERALLPEHPAGVIELTDADLDQVLGGVGSHGCHMTPPLTVAPPCLQVINASPALALGNASASAPQSSA